MKQYLTLVFLFLSLVMMAQITVNNTDMPSPGDTLRTSIALYDETYDFTRTGNNYNWNFEALSPIMQTLDTFLSITQTPVSFWPFFITSANLATRINPASVLPGLPEIEAYDFFNNTSSSFKDVGYGIMISGVPLPLKYSTADMIYKFPMTNGTTHESASGLELAIPDMGYILIDRDRSSIVDGWGTLTTPFGTFEVLRLKSTVSEYDSIYVDSLQQGIPLYRNYTEYQWIGKNQGLPLLNVREDALFGSTVVYLDSARIINVGFPEQQWVRNCLVVPNPVADECTFHIDQIVQGEALLSLFDMKGRAIITQSVSISGSNTILLRFDGGLSTLSPGVYTAVIQCEKAIYSSRIVKR